MHCGIDYCALKHCEGRDKAGRKPETTAHWAIRKIPA
jgi:hypothetical protein